MTENTNTNPLIDLDLEKLGVKGDDKATVKLLMLIEGTYGIGVKESIKKYGYTEQRYYQLKKDFIEKGSQALIDKKRGPRDRHTRKKQVDMQIIRMRFLDPNVSAAVIAQKLNQAGIKISQRSVERTITEYGLQKKLYKLSPDKVEEQVTCKIQQTKRKQLTVKVTPGSNERHVREKLAHKLSGSHMGLWLM